jgi:NAD(P)-dependent dehydrogenase (short-subunit alcohol dehydrogenase family)
VIASQAGHTQPHYRPSRTKALASTPAADLVGLPFHSPTMSPTRGGAYALAKRANILRVQAESMTWDDKGARLNSLSPGIFMTPLGMDELNGPGGEGYQRMIKASAAGRVGTPTRSARQPHS